MLNGASLGLSRWTLVSKAEYNFGNAMNFDGQVLIPMNTAINFPGYHGSDRFDISTLFLTYSWKPGNQILAGKINMIDMAATAKYTGGSGIDSFWNLGFAAPINGITPPYVLGAISTITGKKLNWTFMVYDPVSIVGKSGFENPFQQGVVLSVAPGWNVKMGNSTGNHSLTLTYSTQNGKNLYSLGNLNSPVPIPYSDKKGRFYASYAFNQPIKNLDDKRSWGVFGQLTFSDGNPTPVDYSFLLGLGGSSFFNNRLLDTWGIAFYNYSLSNTVDDVANSFGIPLKNEFGMETYYQFGLNNWFSIGGDIQVTKPVIKNFDTAVFLGVRSSIKL